ncbi:DHHC palmitoyltransferase-domain-containing protein [Collybia nuda]|uniref:Palmitoyltransferase n=1 Tax=Collybia nuda TaxID=64659 RepID=A0A9P5XVS5_9AGAR|nr:DHHC palmitoyltransferase-domain-containing protein [Collybia nuda]
MSYCSRTVFRCFKALERFGDRVTGAAGPFFVGLAVLLIGAGTVCFFEVISPTLACKPLTLPLCVLIAANLHAHYYYVCTVPPGFVEDPPREGGGGLLWARKRGNGNGGGRGRVLTGGRGGGGGVRWSEEVRVTRAEVTRCGKCGQAKPERTHHCRICNRCVLKYDHHCPVSALSFVLLSGFELGINQCVGLHNERHFVMFMAYLVLSTFCLSVLGYQELFNALGVSYTPWPHTVPEIMYIMIYILSGVLCLAVGIMLAYHLYGIGNGETSVEGQDHEVYRKRAKARGEEFVNSYDLGKWKNLQLFFNIGEHGYPLYTLILPLRIDPYTDGRSWARRAGYERHHGVRSGEELTDDDGDGDDEA